MQTGASTETAVGESRFARLAACLTALGGEVTCK